MGSFALCLCGLAGVGGSSVFEWSRLGFVLAAFVCFFFVLSRSMSLASSPTLTPWRSIVSIFSFAVVGIFLLVFAVLLARVGGGY